jgi:hypothetical protein
MGLQIGHYLIESDIESFAERCYMSHAFDMTLSALILTL